MPSKNKKLSIATDIFNKDIEGFIRKIPIHQINPAKEQPRINKDINIAQLAGSLKEDGLLQPIVVTKQADKYMIIAGERRYRAAKSLNWEEIECRVLNKETEAAYKLAIIENIQREQLGPFEEALAFKNLKERFDYTDKDIANKMNKSRNYVSEILSICEIPTPMQHKAVELGLSNKNMLVQLSQAIKKDKQEEFLENYEKGSIHTVKDAKNFLKQEQAIPEESLTEEAPLHSNNKPLFKEDTSSNYIKQAPFVPSQNPSTPLAPPLKEPLNTPKPPSNAIFNIDYSTKANPKANQETSKKHYVQPYSIEFEQLENQLKINISINKKISTDKIIPYITECLKEHILDH